MSKEKIDWMHMSVPRSFHEWTRIESAKKKMKMGEFLKKISSQEKVFEQKENQKSKTRGFFDNGFI